MPLGQPFACASPLVLRWLLPAAWQLEVAGSDAVGNTATPLRLHWTVALEPGPGPVLRLTRCMCWLVALPAFVGKACNAHAIQRACHCICKWCSWSTVLSHTNIDAFRTPCCSGPVGVQRTASLPAFTWVALDANGQAAPASNFECSFAAQGQRGGEAMHACAACHGVHPGMVWAFLPCRAWRP